MFKKDFELVAGVIRRAYDGVQERDSDGARVPTLATITLEEVVIDLCNQYQQAFDRFDARRFHLAALGHIDAHLAELDRKNGDL